MYCKLMVLLCVFCCCLFAENLVEVSPEIHHFGVIKDSEATSAQFNFINRSDKVLEILNVKTFCGCTFAEPKTRSLRPGEKTVLTVNFNPKGKQDYLNWEVHVFTNLQEAAIPLKFDATILRDHYMSDDIVSFGEFRQGKSHERIIWLSPQDYPNFVVNKVELNIDDKNKREFFELRYGMGTYDKLYPGERKSFWAKVITTEKLPFGKVTGNLSFHTNIPGKEYIRLPLFGKVASDISLSRDHIAMGLVTKGKATMRNLMVYPTEEDEKVKVLKVESSLSFFNVNVHTIIENQYYEIKIVSNVLGDEQRGEFRGKILIHTNNEKQSIIEVPIQGFVR